MEVIHVTSIYSLERILESGLFVAVSGHPLNGDSGFNCFDKRSGYWDQRIEGNGALLKCEWSGPMQVIGRSKPPPYPPNVLYDMHPWRMFIPVGTDKKHVKVTRIYIAQWALDDYADYPAIPGWYPAFIARRLRRARKLKLLRRLRTYYRKNTCHLDITGP